MCMVLPQPLDPACDSRRPESSGAAQGLGEGAGARALVNAPARPLAGPSAAVTVVEVVGAE